MLLFFSPPCLEGKLKILRNVDNFSILKGYLLHRVNGFFCSFWRGGGGKTTGTFDRRRRRLTITLADLESIAIGDGLGEANAFELATLEEAQLVTRLTLEVTGFLHLHHFGLIFLF